MQTFKVLRTIGILCVLTALTSCGATVDVTKTAKGFFAPTDPDFVEILQTLPNRAFIELATVSTNRWSPKQTAKMHNALREKSAALGADAVILQNTGVNQGSYSSYMWATGVAIKYK